MIKTNTDCLKAYIFGAYNLINSDVQILKIYRYVIVLYKYLQCIEKTIWCRNNLFSLCLNHAINLFNTGAHF